MKGNPEVLKALNAALKSELTAIHQYMVHSEMQTNWGYPALGAISKKEAFDEMKHAERLIDQICRLDGIPEVGVLDPVNAGKTVHEMIQADLASEQKAVKDYNAHIQVAVQAVDNDSRALFEKHLGDEMRHASTVEGWVYAIDEIGLEPWLAQFVRET